MREIRLKMHDVAAVALWGSSIALLVVDSVDGRHGILAAWAMLTTAAAAVATLVGWTSRRIAELDVTDAQRIATINHGLSVLDGNDSSAKR